MGVKNMLDREHELLHQIFSNLDGVDNLNILAGDHKDRLGVVSFYIDNLHFNLGVKLLNDKFGIQTRGGCSCAGTYGHYLLHVDQAQSHSLVNEISLGDLIRKPGWIRMSIHPTTTCNEMDFVCESLIALAKNHKEWAKDYEYNKVTNEFIHKSFVPKNDVRVSDWFEL